MSEKRKVLSGWAAAKARQISKLNTNICSDTISKDTLIGPFKVAKLKEMCLKNLKTFSSFPIITDANSNSITNMTNSRKRPRVSTIISEASTRTCTADDILHALAQRQKLEFNIHVSVGKEKTNDIRYAKRPKHSIPIEQQHSEADSELGNVNCSSSAVATITHSDSQFSLDNKYFPVELFYDILRYCCPIDVASICCTSKTNYNLLCSTPNSRKGNRIIENDLWRWFYHNDEYCKRFSSRRQSLIGSLPKGRTYKGMVIGLSTGRCYECGSKMFCSYAGVPYCTDCDDPKAPHYLNKTSALKIYKKKYGISEKLLNSAAHRVRDSGCRRHDGSRRVASYLFRREDLEWYLESDREWIAARKSHEAHLLKTHKRNSEKQKRIRSALIKSFSSASGEQAVDSDTSFLDHPLCQKMMNGKLRVRKDMQFVVDIVQGVDNREKFVTSKLKDLHPETHTVLKQIIHSYIEEKSIDDASLSMKLRNVSDRLHERDRELGILLKHVKARKRFQADWASFSKKIEEYILHGKIKLNDENDQSETMFMSLKQMLNKLKGRIIRENQVANVLAQLPEQVRARISTKVLLTYVHYGAGYTRSSDKIPCPTLKDIVKAAVDQERRKQMAKKELARLDPICLSNVRDLVDNYIKIGFPSLKKIILTAKEYETRTLCVVQALDKLNSSVRSRVNVDRICQFLEARTPNPNLELSLESIIQEAAQRDKRAKALELRFKGFSKTIRSRITKKEVDDFIQSLPSTDNDSSTEIETLFEIALKRDSRAKELDERLKLLSKSVKTRISKNTMKSFIMTGYPSMATMIQEAMDGERCEIEVKAKLSRLSPRVRKHLTQEEIDDSLLNSNISFDASELVQIAVAREERASHVEIKLSTLTETIRSRIRKQTLDMFIRYGAVVSQGQLITNLDSICALAQRQHNMI